jgi:NhaA family Na+:H+ antiporter
VPLALRVFLTSLAIVDDLGALIVIAVFYTENIAGNYLVYCGIVIALFALANALGIRHVIVYGILAALLWYFVLKSGVHATIAGVIAAMFIPARSRVDGTTFVKAGRDALSAVEAEPVLTNLARSSPRTRAAVSALERSCRQVIPPLYRMELDLIPWVAFLIVPVFAFANAGITFAENAGELTTSRISLGIAAGLVLGKPLGIFGFAFLAVKLGLATLPAGVTWRHILGAGLFGGIGFTMALFIGNLAFTGDDLTAAKIGILGASAIAAIAGLIVLAGVKPAAIAGDGSTV